MTAKKMADIFFGKFSELISSEQSQTKEIQSEEKINLTMNSKPKIQNNKILIIAGGVITAAILIYLLF